MDQYAHLMKKRLFSVYQVRCSYALQKLLGKLLWPRFGSADCLTHCKFHILGEVGAELKVPIFGPLTLRESKQILLALNPLLLGYKPHD